MGSATVKVYLDGTGVLSKVEAVYWPNRRRTHHQIHMVTASDLAVVGFCLSSEQAYDAPEGIVLLANIKCEKEQKYLLMDLAYTGR